MSTVLSESKPSIYEAVTQQIIAAIEAGAGTFVMPWHGSVVPMTMPKNAATGMPYHGVNVVALWAQATNKRLMSGYPPKSRRQPQAIGCGSERPTPTVSGERWPFSSVTRRTPTIAQGLPGANGADCVDPSSASKRRETVGVGRNDRRLRGGFSVAKQRLCAISGSRKPANS